MSAHLREAWRRRVEAASEAEMLAWAEDQAERTSEYPRGEGACLWIPDLVKKEFGLKADEGFYVVDESKDWVFSHCWNVMPDGSIFDPTAGQFSRSGPIARIIRRSDPEYKRYVHWEDLTEEQQERYDEVTQGSHGSQMWAARRTAAWTPTLYRALVLPDIDRALDAEGRFREVERLLSSRAATERASHWTWDKDWAKWFAEELADSNWKGADHVGGDVVRVVIEAKIADNDSIETDPSIVNRLRNGFDLPEPEVILRSGAQVDVAALHISTDFGQWRAFPMSRRIVASVGEVVEEMTTLTYGCARPHRLAIYDPEAGPSSESYHDAPGLVAFLDWTPDGDGAFIHYMHVRADYTRRGLARRLVQYLYDHTTGEIDWGKIASDEAETLWRSFREAHPDRGNWGKIW